MICQMEILWWILMILQEQGKVKYVLLVVGNHMIDIRTLFHQRINFSVDLILNNKNQTSTFTIQRLVVDDVYVTQFGHQQEEKRRTFSLLIMEFHMVSIVDQTVHIYKELVCISVSIIEKF